MPQKQIRINYDTFIYAEPQLTDKLSSIEKAEHQMQERTNHVISLFWLLSRIEIDFEQLDEEYVSMLLRSAGSLGTQIAEGILGDLSILTDALEGKEKIYESAIS